MITSGWANNSGVELFTIGWVTTEVIPIEPVAGGGGSFSSPSNYTHYNQAPSVDRTPSKPRRFLNQAMHEDEELVILLTTITGILK